MDNQRNIIRYSSNYLNYFNHIYHHNIHLNLNNINIQKSFVNQNINFNSKNIKNFNPNNRSNNLIFNNIKLNSKNNNINDLNIDIKSNYSLQSNSSGNTIKSMLDIINKNVKKAKDTSFKEIKYRKYGSDIVNSSNLTQNGNYLSFNKCINCSNIKDINKNYPFTSKSKNQIMKNNQINILIKQRIENAKVNEELLLPPYELNFDTLNITKPIKIKGQQNSCLIINEGPILIDLVSFNNKIEKKIINTNNNTIKFCQLRIIYNENLKNKDEKIKTLFKLHPGSILELEDCDLTYQNKKNEKNIEFPYGQKELNEEKSVAFVLSSNKKTDNSNFFLNNTNLTLTNTRIHNFYQSIRAGQNCTANINKSAFIQNYGKAIVMLNPLSLKVNETFFQYNGDNTIHIKYIEDCLYEEKRILIINKNEFQTNNGNSICIEGLKNSKTDISVFITKNIFYNNTTDGVLIYNLIYNYFDISNNIFKKNKGNGLNIQKLFFNSISLNNQNYIAYQPIKIIENQFIENRGFGLFVNDCIIAVISNEFTLNKQSGMSLCNIMIDNPQEGYNGINLRPNLNEDEYSSLVKSLKRKINLLKNSFYENGESGLFILEYPYHVNIVESLFSNNCSYGISVDLDNFYKNINMNNNNFKHFSKILSEFNSIVSQKAIDLSNISLFKCIIEKNMKAGILMNSSLIYCEESFIMNNNEYAISIKKKEHQFCFKGGKNNMINGSIGGNWGKIHLFSNVTCFSCIDRPKFDNKKKEEITKKIPSFINQSDKSFDRERKTNYSYSTSPSDRVNKSSYKNDKRIKNYNADKNSENQKNQECPIF